MASTPWERARDTKVCERCGSSYARAYARGLEQWRKSRFCSPECYNQHRHDLTSCWGDRFWSKVDRSAGPDGCWPWAAQRTRQGYGVFNINRLPQPAHRVAADLAQLVGDGSQVLHSCDNPPCCNPRHLRRGTRSENMQDMTDRNRRHGMRLNRYAVLALRWLHSKGVSRKRLMDAYRLHPSTVSGAIYGHTWRHVPSAAAIREGGE